MDVEAIRTSLAPIADLPLAERVAALNAIRETLHSLSPFQSEPVDFVRWVPSDSVQANDYNPNTVAPPEMALLRVSIMADGYTQPIVGNREGCGFTVVDGFHRNRVGKECADVRDRVQGYLPVVQIRATQIDESERMASTIRHNRARGKHRVEAMSDIVVELKRRNWSDERIAKNLGMDPDEVLRLSQISGLAELFANQAFSQAWDVNKDQDMGSELLSDVASEAPDNGNRYFHTFDKWECYRHHFYDEAPEGMTQEQGEERYRAFLADPAQFRAALEVVTTAWPFSTEHYLTNDRMNRIAWLGQASVAQARGIPSCCRGGYHRLTPEQQQVADALALEYLNRWLAAKDRPAVTMEEAGGRTEAELY